MTYRESTRPQSCNGALVRNGQIKAKQLTISYVQSRAVRKENIKAMDPRPAHRTLLRNLSQKKSHFLILKLSHQIILIVLLIVGLVTLSFSLFVDIIYDAAIDTVVRAQDMITLTQNSLK